MAAKKPAKKKTGSPGRSRTPGLCVPSWVRSRASRSLREAKRCGEEGREVGSACPPGENAEEALSTQDFWPGTEGDPTTGAFIERRGRLPNDLLTENLDLAQVELYHRLRNKKQLDEMSTATLARIIKDLAGLKLGRDKGEKPTAPRDQIINVLALVEGVNDPQRKIKLLKTAQVGAEHPDVIEAAIKELEEAANGNHAE